MRATYKLAHAAGWDAGNRSAKAAGRTVWNEDDYNTAAKTCNEILDTMEAPGNGKRVSAEAESPFDQSCRH